MRFLFIDVIGFGGILVIGGIVVNQMKAKRRKQAMMKVEFIDGPLDGQTKVMYPRAVYQYRTPRGVAVYKHEGLGLYLFDEYVEEGL
jgi:hypothetical protein